MSNEQDQFQGVGGCYEIDANTGERKRVAGPDPDHATPGDPLPDNECHVETEEPTQD